MTCKEFEMTDEDFADIMAACKPVPMIALQCGTPSSPQERANAAWSILGKKMGFDHMTVRPVKNKGQKFFTANAQPGTRT